MKTDRRYFPSSGSSGEPPPPQAGEVRLQGRIDQVGVVVGEFDGEAGRDAVEDFDRHAFLGVVDEAVVDSALFAVGAAAPARARIAVFRAADVMAVAVVGQLPEAAGSAAASSGLRIRIAINSSPVIVSCSYRYLAIS